MYSYQVKNEASAVVFSGEREAAYEFVQANRSKLGFLTVYPVAKGLEVTEVETIVAQPVKKHHSGKSKPYQGHRNWNHWNVSLWIGNDEGLYRMAQNFIDRYPRMSKAYVAEKMLERLADEGITKTPDGAPYSVTTITAALRGL